MPADGAPDWKIDSEFVLRQDGRVMSGESLNTAAIELAERLTVSRARRVAVSTWNCATILTAIQACKVAGIELLLLRS
jgi:hypothetical protein